MPPYADLFLSILRRVNPGYPAGPLPLILEIIAYLGDFAIYTYGIVCASSVAICSNVLIGYGTCCADARSIRLIILALVLMYRVLNAQPTRVSSLRHSANTLENRNGTVFARAAHIHIKVGRKVDPN